MINGTSPAIKVRTVVTQGAPEEMAAPTPISGATAQSVCETRLGRVVPLMVSRM